MARSIGRWAARFGSTAVLVLMVGAFFVLDLVRPDTDCVCDRVRHAIVSGSGLTFLTFRASGLGVNVNCSCSSFDRFFFSFDRNKAWNSFNLRLRLGILLHFPNLNSLSSIKIRLQ